MIPTEPQPEGSTRIDDHDPIRRSSATHCVGEAASVSWAYGMPLSYVHEMANHWLSFYNQTLRLPAADGSTNSRDDELKR